MNGGGGGSSVEQPCKCAGGVYVVPGVDHVLPRTVH